MSNFDMFVQYAVQSVNISTNVAVVGLIDSGLTRKQVKAAVRKVAKKTNAKFSADVTDHAVYFNIEEPA